MTASHDTRRPWRSRFARLHPKLYLGAHALGGVLATIALTWLFIAIAEDIPEQSMLVRLDRFVAHWIEAHGTELGETIFSWVSYLGSPVLIAAVVATLGYLTWRRDWTRALAVALASGGGVIVSHVLKQVFHRGRPETASEFILGQSWSFPSGHAMNSMIGYGFLTLLLLERVRSPRRRRAILAAVAILIGAIGFSRVYLGVHYPSDVAGGWIAGAGWLVACVTGYHFAMGSGEHARSLRRDDPA